MPRTPDIERVPRELVVGYLERISSSAFSDFPRQLTTLIGNQHGVYALYKGDRLYYVGLASNLRSRIKHHLRDRHRGKWNGFSLYLVRRAGHLHELESLIVRIADPRGNKSAGRLRHADNLRSELQSRIKAAQTDQMREVLRVDTRSETGAGEERRRKPRPPRHRGGRRPTLAPYVHARFTIRATHKGERCQARVRSDGTINFSRQVYTSPTSAAKAATGWSVDGWHFWRFKDKHGNWVKLDALRKRQ